jgi:hypothetical protein
MPFGLMIATVMRPTPRCRDGAHLRGEFRSRRCRRGRRLAGVARRRPAVCAASPKRLEFSWFYSTPGMRKRGRNADSGKV